MDNAAFNPTYTPRSRPTGTPASLRFFQDPLLGDPLANAASPMSQGVTPSAQTPMASLPFAQTPSAYTPTSYTNQSTTPQSRTPQATMILKSALRGIRGK